MKKLLLALICLLPHFLQAQSIPVPADLYLGGLHVRLTEGGRTVVQQKVDALRRHTTSFQNRVALADAHFPLIDRELQQLGVPLDFHFLAIQESGLQGDAQSIHDAVGYWQFKRESAQDFGLLVNEVVDERKHISASTRAAAKYLVRSNGTYRNWLNALLSYNLGLNGARPYTLPTDAGATEMEVSEKTHPYILTFLAHKVAYEPACGQNPKPALLLQEFPAVAGQQLAQVAELLHTSPEELARHNRWLLAGATVPAGRSYTLIVPVTDPLQLTAMAVQQKQVATELIHKPQTDPENADFVRINGLRALIALPGDTKESLAKRANLKVRKLMHYNDLFLFDNITPGQAYFVQKKRDKAAVEYHIAQPGETVAAVSQKYGVRSKAIWGKNRMARNEEMRPGRLLWLQHTRPRETAVEYLPVNNPAALAAFERSAPAAPPAPAPARTPRADNTDVYSGRTASGQRVLDDSPDAEAETDSTALTSRLSRLLKKPTGKPTAKVSTPAVIDKEQAAEETVEASVTKPAPAPAPKPNPTNRAIYSGTQNERNLPPSAPVADEPAPVAEEPVQPAIPAVQEVVAAAPIVAAPAPVASPAPQPSAPATQPAPTAVPNASVVPPTAAQTSTAVELVPANGMHIVQPKESLYSVARRYGLRPAELITWNNLPQNPSLRIGQTLRVVAPTTDQVAAPAPETAAVAPAVVPSVQHTVVKGESMYSISRKYGVTIKQIMEWNNKPDFNVKPGEKLEIKPAK